MKAEKKEKLAEKTLNFKPKLSDRELIKGKKDELKKEIKETSILLKGLCNDAKFADELIDKLLSLKGQYDVEPTLVHVPIESIIKTYDYGHFKLYRTDKGIVFHMAGMYQLIPPMMQTLYGQLEFLLDQKDKYVSLSKKERKIYNTVFGATMAILMNPTICFSDDDYWIDIATYITSMQNELFDKFFNEDLHEEDAVADAEFNDRVEFVEKLKEDAKEYAKEQGGLDELKGGNNELQ